MHASRMRSENHGNYVDKAEIRAMESAGEVWENTSVLDSHTDGGKPLTVRLNHIPKSASQVLFIFEHL